MKPTCFSSTEPWRSYSQDVHQTIARVVDVDPEFDNTEEWYEAIPAEVRPDKEQPFYHLLAENSDSYYSAYVSQQNLLPDSESGPIHHPDIDNLFSDVSNGRYILKSSSLN